MPNVTLKVKVEPDFSEFNRQLKGKKLGLGSGIKSKAKGETEGIEVKGFKKLLASVFGITAILKALNFIIGPVLALLSAILVLLFLPLIPILRPALVALSNFTKKFAEFARMSKKGWELFLSNPTKAMWILIEKALTSLKEAILSGLITLAQNIIGTLNKIPGINVKIPQNPFLQSNASRSDSSGGSGIIPSSPLFNQSTPTGQRDVPPPVIVNLNNPVVQTPHDANTLADKVANKVIGIFKSGLTRTLPLLRWQKRLKKKWKRLW